MRTIIRCLCLSCAILFVFLIMNGCNEERQTQTSDKTTHSLNITVDPRMELLAVVEFLSDCRDRRFLVNEWNFPYKNDVIKYFSPYKNHPAVKLFTEMVNSDVGWSAYPDAMLYLSDPPDLRFNSQPPLSLKLRFGKRMDKFIEELRDFAQETDFMAFFEAHKNLFSQIVADAYKKTEGVNFISTMENYYGMKQHSYNVIIVPLFSGSYGLKKRADNSHGVLTTARLIVDRIFLKKWTNNIYDIYTISAPSDVVNGVPMVERDYVLSTHEFGHSFVNPTVQVYEGQINRYSSLFVPTVAEKMNKQGYGDWYGCAVEHILRAIEVRLAFIRLGQQEGEKQLQFEKNRGFVYVETLSKQLEQYETQRNKYPTFMDFCPELIKVFDELSKKDLGKDFYSFPFAGNINAVAMGESIVLMIPTHESDKIVQDKIHVFVRKIRDRFSKDSPIITDEEALKRDLSANSIIIYGTTRGNLWLAHHFAELPILIEPERIVADTVYPGTHLRLITVWPNPKDRTKGMKIYTAQQAEDIVGINGVLHGPTDYVIARDTTILKAGYYKKEKGKWSFK